ncbi:MAG: ATP-binding protein [Candidatus Melainabacteria bacterium]
MASKTSHLVVPKLKLYQQVIITFVVVVMLPLLGISFTIYSINQKALKKEIALFTEHTTEGIFKDFQTEMTWQSAQSRLMRTYLLERFDQSSRFQLAADGLFQQDDRYAAVAIYDAAGQRLNTAYNPKNPLPKDLRLPERLTEPAQEEHYQVLFAAAAGKDQTPYYLQSLLPVPASDLAKRRHAAYYLELKRFNYLSTLIRTNQDLYDGLYIVDADGKIIAGPDAVIPGQQVLNEKDRQFLLNLPDGVLREFSTEAQTPTGDDDDENQPLQKVYVKMPDIHWGIILESPYHVRQKYIRRARVQTLFLIAGCLVLVAIGGLVYSLGISRNFRQLIKGIKAMAGGNYTRRIRLITNFFTPYEIVYLAGEFNRMARKTADAWQTIQEKNAELAKLDELKSNLMDTVSHELRTPLTNIKGYTSRLIRYDKTLDAPTRMKSLKVVKNQADRLGRLVEDLLVIPDLDNAKLRVFPDRVSLGAVMENVLHLMEARDRREILLDMASEVDVLADPDRLEQILLNLLDNAAKYSLPDTPITVRVEADERLVLIAVRNQCEPIPEEKQPEVGRLFEKFTRLDESLVRTTRGSGLGLFIAKGLVEAMGGHIHLSYTPHAPADTHDWFEITFTLPRLLPEQVAETRAPAVSEASAEIP